MPKTGLIAEVIVLGGQAFVWLFAFALWVAPELAGVLQSHPDLSWSTVAALLAVPGLGITYALGWSVSYLAHRVFGFVFRLRDRYRLQTHDNAAFYFYQFASPALVVSAGVKFPLIAG